MLWLETGLYTPLHTTTPTQQHKGNITRIEEKKNLEGSNIL